MGALKRTLYLGDNLDEVDQLLEYTITVYQEEIETWISSVEIESMI